MSIVPTLLIGLGGIGSQVVELVYNQIPETERDTIAVHAFDTDISDIEQRTYLRNCITQTSKAITVGHYLSQDKSVKDWFPHEVKLLNKKTLAEGAGQIRCVSRLAYRAAMQEGKLDDLINQISSIFRARGNRHLSSVRVMIVTSLAGGTGAGIFLQTALYLRELLEQTFRKDSILIRGAFLLPDTLVQTKVLPEDQWDNVRANAYACIKELDAITRNANSQSMGQHEDISIEFEYRPDQVDMDGRQIHTISSHHLPYDFCFLYDYLSSKSEQIGDFTNYLKMMADTIFIQLFSPISTKHFSIEDNFIQKLIGAQGTNRYCSAGRSRIVYPYEQIVDYCALRLAEKSISGEWRKLDEDFNEEMRRYEEDINMGVAREEPDIGKFYIALLDKYMGGDGNYPFFKRIYRSVHLYDDRNRESGPVALKFIEAVEAKIQTVLDSDTELNQAEKDCRLDEGKLNNRERSLAQVSETESNIEVLQSLVNRAVQDHKNFIFSQVIGEDCRTPGSLAGDEDFRLNAWILKRPQPLHPVAVRYLLYQIRNLLGDRIRELSDGNSILRKGIVRYSTKYSIPDTDYVETAEDRVRSALKQPIIGRIFKNRFKEFVDDYHRESGKQVKNLARYKVNYLKELVFSEINKALDELIGTWERFFRDLRSLQEQLQSEIESKAVEHEVDSDPTRKFVLASRKRKESIWEAIRPAMIKGSLLPDEICRKINVGQHKQFCNTHIMRTGFFNEGGMRIKTADFFREDVLPWCKKTIKELEEIDRNVISALKQESLLMGLAPSTYIAEEIVRLDELAKPMIQSNASDSKSVVYWGTHPENIAELGNGNVTELFGDSNMVITNDAFSIYELTCYKNLNGLKVENLTSFSAGDLDKPGTAGAYFRSYFNRINMMKKNPRKTITPHLDKRWHLSAYMKDPNSDMVAFDTEKTERALILGLIHGRLRAVDKFSSKIWECQTESSGLKTMTLGGQPAKWTFYECYRALFFNPFLVDTIHEYASKSHEEFRQKGLGGSIDNHPFYTGCNQVMEHVAYEKKLNILDCILIMNDEAPTNKDFLGTIDHLLELLITEIADFYKTELGSPRKEEAKTKSLALISKLQEDSSLYKKNKNTSPYLYKRWKESIGKYIKKNLDTE